MAAPTRIGRYDNPYAVADWSRPPPSGTRCEPLALETADRARAEGWLYRRGGEDTAVLVVHPRANFSHHYIVPGLVDAGYAVLCLNTRWLNNDATLIHEVVLLDVAAGMAALRERYDRVVVCGNSGGGSLLWINYGAVGFGRIVSPEAWLSTWSGTSSRASIARTGASMTLPALVVSYTGDHGIFPSDTELLVSSIAAPRVDRVEIDADHYGFRSPSAAPARAATVGKASAAAGFPSGRDDAVAAIADWINGTA